MPDLDFDEWLAEFQRVCEAQETEQLCSGAFDKELERMWDAGKTPQEAQEALSA